MLRRDECSSQSMTNRLRALVFTVVVLAAINVWSVSTLRTNTWLPFLVYLVATLLSSGMKVAMPKSDGTMSVNFVFIFLGFVQLSPLQTATLAACSVLAQCRFRVVKSFTVIQILFNLANVISATILAWQINRQLIERGFQVAPALAVAALAYFFANSIPVAIVIA